MTLYERIHNTVEAEIWTGDEDGIARMVTFAGPAVKRVLPADEDQAGAVCLVFYCAKAEAELKLRPGMALAAERDGTGFYPIAADVLAADFRPVAPATDDASPTAAAPDDTSAGVAQAADAGPNDDEILQALLELEATTPGGPE